MQYIINSQLYTCLFVYLKYSFLLLNQSLILIFLQYTAADIEAFCNWWETGGREARDAMKATEASRIKLYSSCAINLIDSWWACSTGRRKFKLQLKFCCSTFLKIHWIKIPLLEPYYFVSILAVIVYFMDLCQTPNFSDSTVLTRSVSHVTKLTSRQVVILKDYIIVRKSRIDSTHDGCCYTERKLVDSIQVRWLNQGWSLST